MGREKTASRALSRLPKLIHKAIRGWRLFANTMTILPIEIPTESVHRGN